MNKKSSPINYKKTIPNPDYTKEFSDAVKYELCVTMRLKDIEPKPNCYENRKDLITRLKRNGVGKAVDLGGINSAKLFREYLNKHKIKY